MDLWVSESAADQKVNIVKVDDSVEDPQLILGFK